MIYLGNQAVGIATSIIDYDAIAMGEDNILLNKNIILSNSATYINTKAFSGTPIASITAPEVHTINTRAFFGCYNINSAFLPKVTHIGLEAFRESTLKSVYAPNAIIIEGNAFRATKIPYAIFPNVINLGPDCFYANTLLQGVDLGNKTITSSFQGTHWTLEYNPSAITILRYGYVLPAQDDWFYNGYWMKKEDTPGILYVWQDLISQYQSNSIWGPILQSNNNQILPIEGSIYEYNYVDGTPISN